MEEHARTKTSEKSVTPKPAAPVKRGTLSAIPRFEQELERFFGSHNPWRFDWPLLRSTMGADLPNVDVIDRDEDVIIRASLPGYEKKDIDISMNGDRVTISASSAAETKQGAENGDYYCHEISRGYVTRTIPLPAEVIGDKAKAKLTNGVLELTVPKAAKSKRQTIRIES